MNGKKHSGVWVLAEQSEGKLARVGFELLGRGRTLADKLSAELVALVIGAKLAGDELNELIARGADRVIAVEDPRLEHFLCEPHAACMCRLIEQRRPEIVIAAATTTGRTLMPYVAVKVGAGLTADCTEMDIEPGTGNLLQTRPAIGGNILATIVTPDARPQMATVRPHSTRPAERRDGRSGTIERVRPTEDLLASRVRRVAFEPSGDRQALQDADRVVTVGRGVRKADNIPLVGALAEQLHAAMGATRDVVDRGWMSYPHQVGLSGKTVSPRLYLAVGVSGSIQHLAGMQTAETIVAINNDPEAQIFKVADFGIVGDLFEVVPALVKKLRSARGERPERNP